MKNFWLITGGISLGVGISLLLEKNPKPIDNLEEFNKEKTNKALFQLIGGSLLILGGIYGLKNK